MIAAVRKKAFPAGIPKYRCLADEVRRMVAGGDLGPNNTMLADNHLMKRYGVSRSTVRQAMDLLVADGLVVRRPGKGTFVREQATATISRVIRIVSARLEDVIRNTYMADLLGGAEEAAGAAGIRVTAHAVPEGSLGAEALERLAGGPGVKAGLVLAGRYPDHEVAAVVRRGIPLVTPSMDYYHLGAGSVMSGLADPSTAADLVGLMAENGHTRIALMHPADATERSRRTVQQGYSDGCAAAGISVDPALFRLVATGMPVLEQALDELLALAEPPTALIVMGEPMLRDTAMHLGRRGLRIPEDISLAGTCTVDMDPFYTSFRTDQREMGRVTAAMLMAMMDNPDVLPEKRIIPRIFHAGKSVGAGRGDRIHKSTSLQVDESKSQSVQKSKGSGTV